MSDGSAISSVTELLIDSSVNGVPNIEGGDSDTIFLSAQCYDGGDSSGD